MTRFAVSSWSLDGMLRSGLPVEALPGQLAEHNIPLLELCHFHLASREPTYLQAIRAALQSAGVELFTLLIDTGDLAEPDPDRRRAEMELIAGWLPVAGQLGARRVRISAGRQPPTAQAIAHRHCMCCIGHSLWHGEWPCCSLQHNAPYSMPLLTL